MSGALSVPNTFANAVTATGAQLDANYNTITAYINDPTNRNNYAADSSGGTNTIALSFTPSVTAYTAGLEITFKAANTNTGAVVVNANSLGNKNLVNPDGSTLQSGQIAVGSVYKGAYDGTQFIFISPPSPASKAAVQTATASASFLSPSQVVNSPHAVQAWCQFNGAVTGTQTVTVGSGVSTVIRAGTGTYSITFSTPFASVPYGIAGMCVGLGVVGKNPNIESNTATANVITFLSNTGAASDITHVTFIFMGAQ